MDNDTEIAVSPREALERLVLDEDLERLEDLLAEFNLFDVLKVERREPQHSALLAWLLDPRGSHGLGSTSCVAFSLKLRWRLASVESGKSHRSSWTDGSSTTLKWRPNAHRIDIMLVAEADEFVCLIENKIGAGEHSNQLSRYLDTVEREYEGPQSIPHIPDP